VALSWGSGPWVADTSAWARASDPAVAPQWRTAATVTLELLYDAPDRERVVAVATAVAGLRQAPITRAVTDAAITAVRELATSGSAGAHRVRVPDALIAAAAADRGLGVLHYDQHYDQLAAVLGFHSQWVAPAGSIP
jgi:predicted nucleic acid-binding protein